MKILAVLTVRNEGAYLLEWLAHHMAVGITDFLVFSNDCDDGTDTMLDRLDEMGLVKHIRNDGPHDKGGIQFTAMKRADKRPEVRKADWVITLDADEFINIHVGDHTIPALLAALPDATAITLTWRLFGSMGLARYEDTPILDTFTRAAPEVMYWPWRASMFKTLYRADGTYGKLGIHRPRQPDHDRVEQARWFDGHGRELDAKFKTAKIFSPFGRPNYGLAQLNHYPLGSMENFVIKADRGRAVHGDHMLDLDYWVERNYMIEDDTSIQALAAPRSAQLDALASDVKLAELHAAAVAWRKSRFLELMQLEPYRALYGRLLQTPPSRSVPLQAAHFLTRQANLGRAAEKTAEKG
ncbi:glycosyltransferase family 2 protein [Alisedimentitalea sp. MJ-SS2]|uniref:glycosyltransferase family 2 protein n=1 Tax=Aliisedimentitalea sp. MJ-SS2 TaxID=3049795 RepID=UPI002913B989|nr:glycosyltransferase family 2 protein [Alisedimentitalea sp. MJ-SS2]MDU8926685.1 glycosyltransferase family 2 protein [Alisedimentitalea sp. MJ-SS2]